LVDVIGEQFCAAVSTAATLWVLFISGIPLLPMPDGMRHDRDLWIARGLRIHNWPFSKYPRGELSSPE
jgi:hypothetical protein